MTTAIGRILAACSVDAEVDLGALGVSAIDKRAHSGRVQVGSEGLGSDHVCDTDHHGGADQAVYAYSDAEARRWAEELDRDLPYGWFGENLRTDGIEVSGAIVGERWEIGDDGLILEVTIPRVPCRTFAAWAGEPQWIKRFMDRADVGTYLRVIHTGTVGAGDEIRVVSRPDHGVTARELLAGTPVDAESLRALLANDEIAPKVRREATKRLSRA